MKRAAAIDVGSNSVKLLIAERAESGLRFLRDEARVTRMGERLRETGALQQDAIERTARTVADFARMAREAGAEEIACAGTMALREAKNAEAFVQAVQAACGLTCRVLPGEEEARLCFAAACGALAQDGRETAVMDSGGGSTEFACGRDGTPRRRASVPVGAVNVTERFFAKETTEERVRAAREEIANRIGESGFATERDARLVATGGTATTMAAVARAVVPYDPEKIRGAEITRREAERQVALYASLTIPQRAEIPGMHRGRGDVMLAGACIVAETMRFFGAQRLIVADCGLRHALAQEMLRMNEK